MSMHEIESAFEAAARAIGRSTHSNREKRNLYASVFGLHGYYDVGWTLRRNEQELTEASYLLTCPYAEMGPELLGDHPKIHGDWISDGREPLGINIDGVVYFEAGGLLWHRCLAAGRLTGLAAEPIQRVEPFVALLGQLARIFDEQKDGFAIGTWYLLTIAHAAMAGVQPDPDDVRWQEARKCLGQAEMLASFSRQPYMENELANSLVRAGDEYAEDGVVWWCEPGLAVLEQG